MQGTWPLGKLDYYSNFPHSHVLCNTLVSKYSSFHNRRMPYNTLASLIASYRRVFKNGIFIDENIALPFHLPALSTGPVR